MSFSREKKRNDTNNRRKRNKRSTGTQTTNRITHPKYSTRYEYRLITQVPLNPSYIGFFFLVSFTLLNTYRSRPLESLDYTIHRMRLLIIQHEDP